MLAPDGAFPRASPALWHHSARMVEQEVSARERGERRLRSAANLLYLLAVLKLFAALIAPRAMKGPDAAPVIAWFISGLTVSLLLAYFLHPRRPLVKNLALAWAGLHIAEIFFVARIGMVAVLEAFLGAMILVTILVAAGLGAFEREH